MLSIFVIYCIVLCNKDPRADAKDGICSALGLYSGVLL